MTSPYVPERGDLVWLEFDPQDGHEQRSRRPALTVSPGSYNQKVGLGLFCPVTSQTKGYPFEVGVAGPAIQGVVLTDQLKSLDWRIRRAEFIERIDPKALETVLHRIRLLVE